MPATFLRIPESLRRTLDSQRLSASYLFDGPDAEALREAALEFAAGVLCRKRGCGSCRTCRLARAGKHPDLVLLTRDKATVISVSALEPVLERAHTKPLEGDKQVFLVDPADALEPEGVARYLKALEEPPPGTVFLLLSTRAERLPETVLSRCRRVRFAPLAADALLRRLAEEGVAGDVAARLARWSTGSLARARRMAKTEMLARVDSLLAAAFDREPRVASAVSTLLKEIEASAKDVEKEAEDDETDRGREVLRTSLQDLLAALAVEARDLAAGRPSALAPARSPHEALRVLARLAELSGAVASNVTPTVVLLETIVVLRT